MDFQPILSYQNSKAIKIYEAYTTAFPPEERRSETQFEALFANPNAEICIISNENQEIGYLILWKLNEALFVEHFEIFPDFRSLSFGSKILQKLISENEKIVLESEPSQLNDIAERRINFYQRNNFKVIDEDYIQPSYGIGKPAIQLFLLATYTPINIQDLKLDIYDTVYQF